MELQVLLHAVDVVEDVVHDAGDYAWENRGKNIEFPENEGKKP